MQISTSCFSLCWMAFALLPSVCVGADEAKIVRIEEDWEVLIRSPDPFLDAPQIGTAMSPKGDLKGLYFGVELNHASQAGSSGGGYQTKCIKGETQLLERLNRKGQRLQVQNEKIEWTQVLRLEGTELVFEIKDGRSITWGEFGGPESQVRYYTELDRLNQYSPAVSYKESGVGYAANRVGYMKLKSVRLVNDQDVLYSIPLDQIVHQEGGDVAR